MAKAMSPGEAAPCTQRFTSIPVIPAWRMTIRTFCSTQTSMNRPQVILTARLQPPVTWAKRLSSRASAPKLLTVGLEVMASASAPPMRLSRALDFRLAGRT